MIKRLLLLLFIAAAFAAAQVCPQGYALVGGICVSTTVIGGASTLTTVGAVPYVSAAYTLGQDAGQFFWDATNNRLGIGTNAPIFPISNTGKYGGATYSGSYLDAYSSIVELAGNGGIKLSAGAAGNIVQVFGSTGDVSIGTDQTSPYLVDGNYRLDVQRSGSAGTFRVYDQTATTGTTLVDIRAGAGQVVNTLFNLSNNAGTKLVTAQATAATIRVYNSGTYGWSSTSASDSNSYDTCLGRVSAGLIEVTNCTVNTWRALMQSATYYGGSGATTSAYLANYGMALQTRTGAGGSPTVSQLSTCNSTGQGAWSFVTDALAPAVGSTVAAGGSAKAMVWCNAANWTVIGI